MKVVAVEYQKLDLKESLLNELDDVELSGVVEVDGAIALDDEQRILPLISSFLTESQSNNKTAVSSSKTYGLNLTYCLSYLMGRREFKGFELDEAFITVSKPVLEDYFKNAREKEGLGGVTLRNRDATYKKFFDEFLCKEKNALPPLRNYNPYEDGLLTPAPKSNLIDYCDIETLEALILTSRYERERLVIQFIFDSGVRRTEVGRVMSSDIKDALKFQRAQFYGVNKESSISDKGYIPLKIAGSKGRGREIKERMTLISVASLNRIVSYHASPLYKKYARKYKTSETTPAFFNADGGVFSKKVVDNLIDKTSRRALKNGSIEKKVSPHKLRHGYGYEVLTSPDFGKDYLDRLVHLQKTLGHNDLSSTEIYTRIPVDIYKTMTDEDGVILTKTEKMKKLTARTKLRIKVGDKK